LHSSICLESLPINFYASAVMGFFNQHALHHAPNLHGLRTSADRLSFDAINLFNTCIQQMPAKLLAGPMGLKPRAMFQVTATEKAPINIAMAPTRV
jgi:hypothetical protein